MSGNLNQFPGRNTAFQSASGQIDPVWYNFLFRTWKKTGAGTGDATLAELDANKVAKAGDTMTGALALAGLPTLPAHAASKAYADTKVAKAGDTMTGALLLSGAPTTGLQAATKAYVDAAAGAGTYLPLAGGTMTGAIVLSGAPTVALNPATKTYTDAADALALPKTGGTMTGAIVLPGNPAAALEAAPKQYVDASRATLAPPPTASLTAITATTETALWTPATYSPIAANLAIVGKVFRLTAGGVMSLAATGTLVITPRFGLSVAAGVTMGASIAQTTPGATTALPWRLGMDVVVRAIGAGVTSTVIGTGTFVTGGTGAAGTAVALAFGGTQATVDVTVATGLCIGWTLSVAGSVTPQYVFLEALN